MVSNIELEYLKLEDDNSWRDLFQVIVFFLKRDTETEI